MILPAFSYHIEKLGCNDTANCEASKFKRGTYGRHHVKTKYIEYRIYFCDNLKLRAKGSMTNCSAWVFFSQIGSTVTSDLKYSSEVTSVE